MKRAKVNAKIKTEPSFTNHKIPENLDRIFWGEGERKWCNASPCST